MFDSMEIDVFGYSTEYFHICPGAVATFEHLKLMNVDEDTKGMIRSAAQIADNIFEIEARVILDKKAAFDDYTEALVLVTDFYDLMHEIDEITGMIHDVEYMEGHLEIISNYLSEEEFTN